jgi:hypothetical protein
MNFEVGICRILENIFLYKSNKKDLQLLLNNTFSLYELIEGYENTKFSESFHKYWDFLEEINAIGETDQYQEKIDNEIIPQFISMLSMYLLKKVVEN